MSEMTAAEVAWIAYRNDIQMRTPWENHRRVMRRLRKRDFIAGYLAGVQFAQPAATESEAGDE